MNITKNLLFLASLISITSIGYKGLDLIKSNNSYISTNGLSVRHVASDEAIWNITIINESDALKDAQEKLKKDKNFVLEFLKKCGFSTDEVSEGAIKIEDRLRYSSSKDMGEKKRFEIRETVSIKTQNLNLIEKSLTKLSELIEKNIQIEDSAKYFYKNLDKLRVEMIKEATKDSQNRAKNVAESINTQISGIRNLSTGNFSIMSEDSSATSENDWTEGENSVKKKIRVVVHGTFNLK